MNKKKSYIKAFRITSIATEIIFILLVIIFFTLFYLRGQDDVVGNSRVYLPYMLASCILASLNIILLVYAFEISLNEYNYEGKRIGVYAGGMYHYLYVNDEVVATVKSINAFKTITLSYKDSDIDVVATISSLTHVRCIANGVGLPPVGHGGYENKEAR